MKNFSFNVILVWVEASFSGPVILVELKSRVEQFDQVVWNLLEDIALVTSVMLFKTWHLCNLLVCFKCSLLLLISITTYVSSSPFERFWNIHYWHYVEAGPFKKTCCKWCCLLSWISHLTLASLARDLMENLNIWMLSQ